MNRRGTETSRHRHRHRRVLPIHTLGHPVDPGKRRERLTGAPIDVAENVWIGAGAKILPGVSTGRDAVIAAGSVVADDVPPASLVTGGKAAARRQW